MYEILIAKTQNISLNEDNIKSRLYKDVPNLAVTSIKFNSLCLSCSASEGFCTCPEEIKKVKNFVLKGLIYNNDDSFQNVLEKIISSLAKIEIYIHKNDIFYDNVELPTGLPKEWKKNEIMDIITNLIGLREYTISLSTTESFHARIKAESLAQYIANSILYFPADTISMDVRHKCLTLLDICKNARGITANVALGQIAGSLTKEIRDSLKETISDNYDI